MKKVCLIFCIGCIFGWSFSWITIPRKPTAVEVCLAQNIYDEMRRYGMKSYRLNQVLKTVQEYADGRREEIPPSKVYATLEKVALERVEEEAKRNLEIADEFIQKIQSQDNILAIVKDRVCVEILVVGEGEVIDLKDTVRVEFKELNLKGEYIKKPEGSYTIPLEETIKGFQLGLKEAKIGDKRKLYIHPEYGFGKISDGDPNSLLIYEVTLLEKIKPS